MVLLRSIKYYFRSTRDSVAGLTHAQIQIIFTKQKLKEKNISDFSMHVTRPSLYLLFKTYIHPDFKAISFRVPILFADINVHPVFNEHHKNTLLCSIIVVKMSNKANRVTSSSVIYF